MRGATGDDLVRRGGPRAALQRRAGSHQLAGRPRAENSDFYSQNEGSRAGNLTWPCVRRFVQTAVAQTCRCLIFEYMRSFHVRRAAEKGENINFMLTGD